MDSCSFATVPTPNEFTETVAGNIDNIAATLVSPFEGSLRSLLVGVALPGSIKRRGFPIRQLEMRAGKFDRGDQPHEPQDAPADPDHLGGYGRCDAGGTVAGCHAVRARVHRRCRNRGAVHLARA